MPNQIVLAWTVPVAGTSLGPAGAAAKLAAIPLYTNPTTDPVLGQAFGLTVASDVTLPGAGNATRTLTLNMTAAAGAPLAPPPFPCHPDTPTPPVLPYVLRKTVPLAGFFLTVNGSMVVNTSASQQPALVHNNTIEFAEQPGVFYNVNIVGPTSITLSTPYTGKQGDGTAANVVPNPSKIPALWSTSPLDTNGFATVPAIPAGSGARTISITYLDSTGAGPFTVVTSLTGRRPAAIALAVGSVDIATVTDLHVASTGAFGNSVGEITLVDLSALLPAVRVNATPDDFLGPVTDAAQMLIDRSLVYLPPSYFALTQQGAATPQLAGDFVVTTGSTYVPTSVDQTAVLAAGNTIRFASQLNTTTPFEGVDETYVLADVNPRFVTLARPYTGYDVNKIDSDNDPRPTNQTANAQMQPTGAFLVAPSPAAPPVNAQLASAVGEFVNPGNAVPPPNPPLPPSAMAPAPTVLSGLFTKTIQLALAVPVTAAAITFV